MKPMGLQGTQTLVRATPSPPRVSLQPSRGAFPAPSPIRDTITSLVPEALDSVPELALVTTAVLTRQETDVVPETPQSGQDHPRGSQRIPIAVPLLIPPVA